MTNRLVESPCGIPAARWWIKVAASASCPEPRSSRLIHLTARATVLVMHSRVVAAALAAALIAIGVTLTAQGSAEPPGATTKGVATHADCPRPLRLRPSSVASAAHAALRNEHDRDRSTVVAAAVASKDTSGRGAIARNWCGRKVARRTIVVTIDRRRFAGSASLSSAVYFVSRMPAGYGVWGQPH